MTVGDNIRRLRLEKNWTQKQLGEACKPQIAESTIRRYELGKLNPKRETINRIADALEVFPGDIEENEYFLSSDKFQSFWNTLKDLPIEEKERAVVEFMDNSVDMDLEFEKNEHLEYYNKYTSKNLKKINTHLQKLNTKGQTKAVEAVENLTFNPKYIREE